MSVTDTPAALRADTRPIAHQHSHAAPPDRRGFFFARAAMDFSKLQGLIPAVIQDDETNEVLMVGFMNEEALDSHAPHRVRHLLQPHAEHAEGRDVGQPPAGHELLADCDDDTVLVRVKRLGDGNVCHTGERTCFFRELGPTRCRAGPSPAGVGGLHVAEPFRAASGRPVLARTA